MKYLQSYFKYGIIKEIMTSYLGLYILINITCTIVVLIIAIHSTVGMGGTSAQRYFFISTFTLLLFFISDALWYAMDCGLLKQIVPVSMFLKSIYFFSATFAGYIWFLFMSTLTEASFLKDKRIYYISFIPVLFHFALLLINIKTSFLFGISEDFKYYRGHFFSIQYVFIYAYLIFSSFHAIYQATRRENYLNRLRYIIISTFPILPAISGILQLFYWRIPFNCVAFTIGIVVVYLTELGERISLEPLTGLANRNEFMRDLQRNMQEHKDDGKLYLFMIDIDRFKPINDNYGHVEGDRAIINTGQAIKKALLSLHNRGTLARYGGDEFAIVAILDDDAEVDAIKQAIKKEISELNAGITYDYQIELSIGVVKYTNAYTSIPELIHAADTELYLDKQKKK